MTNSDYAEFNFSVMHSAIRSWMNIFEFMHALLHIDFSHTLKRFVAYDSSVCRLRTVQCADPMRFSQYAGG